MKTWRSYRKLPAILVMIGIFILSALPGNDPLLNSFELNDKIKHVIAYFVLGISICLWIPSAKWRQKTLICGVVMIAICTIFGISDEFHQSFVPGRRGNDIGDIVADFIGGFLAVIIFAYASLRRNSF